MSFFTQRKRKLHFANGIPYVIVGGVRRPIRKLTANGDSNTKLAKSNKYAKTDIRTFGLSLSPSIESGVGNTCASASIGCAEACLNHQGLASVFETITAARIAKTVLFFQERDLFLSMLNRELSHINYRAEKHGFLAAIRLNVFSDVVWEKHLDLESYTSCRFYDYTKHVKRVGTLRENYSTTLSRSESNENDVLQALANGNNVAIPFADSRNPYVGNMSSRQSLPKRWNGYRVFDADQTDLRFTDPSGVVCGLRLKAHSKQERYQAIESNFAVVH